MKIKFHILVFFLCLSVLMPSQTGQKVSVPISYHMHFLADTIKTLDKPLLKDPYTNTYSIFSKQDKINYVNFIVSQIVSNKAPINYSAYNIFYEFNYDQDIQDCKGSGAPHEKIEVNPAFRYSFKPRTDTSVTDEIMEFFKNKKIALRTDSLFDPYHPEKPIINRKYFDMDKHGFSISFLENWVFDYGTGSFTKEVLYYGNNRFKFNLKDEPVSWGDFIFLKNNTPTANWKLYKKNVVYDVCIKKQHIEFANLREDNYTKFDIAPNCYNNFDYINGARFLNYLFAYVDDGKADAYPILNSSRPDSMEIDFTKRLTSDEAKARLAGMDSSNFEDPKNPGQFFYMRFPYKIKLQEVWGMRFYEDWYINEESYSFKKVVKGMVFIDGAKQDKDGAAVKKDFSFYMRFKEE